MVFCEYTHLLFKISQKCITWPGRDLNTQPSELESDALPLRHQALHTPFLEYVIYSTKLVPFLKIPFWKYELLSSVFSGESRLAQPSRPCIVDDWNTAFSGQSWYISLIA